MDPNHEPRTTIPEHLELCKHRVRRLLAESGQTADWLLSELQLTAAAYKKLINRRYPPAEFIARLAKVLDVPPDTLEQTIPAPGYKVRLSLRKLVISNDRAIDRFCGYHLGKELRDEVRLALSEILEETEMQRAALTAQRRPEIIAQAKEMVVAKYKLVSVRQLEFLVDRSDRWRDELDQMVGKLSARV